LSVKDSGEGLLPDQLAAVFDRFYRADKSRSRETGGTGLGLAIVKAIVESHGGQVKARSEGKGKGSEFIIVLPK
jgi:signal transduction histidine kinase